MNAQTTRSTKLPPVSCTSYWTNLLCLISFFAALFFLNIGFPQLGNTAITILCLLATVLPLWLADFLKVKVHQRQSTNLRVPSKTTDRPRLVIKLVGFYGTILVILILYHLLPLYRIAFYQPFFDLLKYLLPLTIVLGFVYFREIDRRQKNPYDGYWHMGCFLTGRWKELNVVFLKEHARVWFIKAFFTPIMFSGLVGYMASFRVVNLSVGPGSFLTIFYFLFNLFYTLDVLYAVLGYILTFHLLDNHIRSTEPTILGWLVCLACYKPFASIFGVELFGFNDGWLWSHWLAFFPPLYYIWGVLILFLTLVYGLATVAFGYRQSNLTYRGIITSGPYRFTKHPAYICKVASWWLISLPFLSLESPQVAFKNTIFLGIISFIYYLRARTEENHLSNYPEYVEYANWIKKHGMFSAITRHFPSLQYSAQKCKLWKSVVWFKKL